MSQQLDHRDAQFGGHGTGRRLAALRHDQGFGVQIAQVELELISPVGHVERSACARAGHGHEGGGHFRAIGQDQADAVPAANTQPVQRLNGAAHEGIQCAVAQGLGRGGGDCDGVRALAGNHLGKCGEGGHDGSFEVQKGGIEL
jgi:hypothetical protein